MVVQTWVCSFLSSFDVSRPASVWGAQNEVETLRFVEFAWMVLAVDGRV